MPLSRLAPVLLVAILTACGDQLPEGPFEVLPHEQGWTYETPEASRVANALRKKAADAFRSGEGVVKLKVTRYTHEGAPIVYYLGVEDGKAWHVRDGREDRYSPSPLISRHEVRDMTFTHFDGSDLVPAHPSSGDDRPMFLLLKLDDDSSEGIF